MVGTTALWSQPHSKGPCATNSRCGRDLDCDHNPYSATNTPCGRDLDRDHNPYSAAKSQCGCDHGTCYQATFSVVATTKHPTTTKDS